MAVCVRECSGAGGPASRSLGRNQQKWVPHSSRFCAKGGRDTACSADFDVPQIRYYKQHHTSPCQQRKDGAPTLIDRCRQLKAWATRPLRLLMLILSIRKNLHFHLVGFSILLYVLNRRRWRIAQFSVLHVLGWASYSVYPEDCCPLR
jgi:hypothetical protein